MGSLPVIQPERIKRPPETHDEGCPGGWYRCNFVDSMLRYERRMSSDGVFSHNILLDRCNDRLIIEATQYLEQQRLARANFGFELRFRK